MTKPKTKEIQAWAIASKKNLGYYYPGSIKAEIKYSINEWFTFLISTDKREAQELLKLQKRHGLDKSFKVVPCLIKITV